MRPGLDIEGPLHTKDRAIPNTYLIGLAGAILISLTLFAV